MAENTQTATRHQKAVDEITSALFSNKKEFAVVPFDGLVMAVHKTAFEELTDTATSFTSLNGRGKGLHRLMTPGTVVPQQPAKVVLPKIEEDDSFVSIGQGSTYMKHACILAGAEHVDKMDKILPEVNLYDDALIKAFEKCFETQIPSGAVGLHGTTGAGLLNSHQPPKPEGDVEVNELFDMFGKEISKEERKDYVLYTVMTLKASTDYALNGSHALDIKRDTTDSGKGPVILPTVFRIPIDNDLLAQPVDRKAFGMMIYTRDNPFLDENAKTKIYGSDMNVSDPVLKNFNLNVREYFAAANPNTFVPLPETRFYVSTVASDVLFECQILYKYTGGQGASSMELLVDRLKAIRSYYLNNTNYKRHESTIGSTSHQKATLALALYKLSSINPSGFLSFRDQRARGKQPFPWHTTENQLKDNNKDVVTALTKDCDPEVKNKATMAEIFSKSQMELCTVLDVNSNMIHADMIVTGQELASFDVTGGGQGKGKQPTTATVAPGAGVKTVGLCSLAYTYGMSYVHYLMTVFNFDPFKFKRFVVQNTLYIKKTALDIDLGNEDVPYPVKNERDSSPKLCPSCGIKFYEKKSDRGCVCFLVSLAASLIAGPNITISKITIQNTFNRLPDNRYLQGGKGEFTRFKNNHQLVINETPSNSSSFGGIHLKNILNPLRRSAPANAEHNAPSNTKDGSEGQDQTGQGQDAPSTSNGTSTGDKKRTQFFQKELDECIPLQNLLTEAVKEFGAQASFHIGEGVIKDKPNQQKLDVHDFLTDEGLSVDVLQDPEHINKGVVEVLMKMSGNRSIRDLAGTRTLKGHNANNNTSSTSTMSRKNKYKPTREFDAWNGTNEDEDEDEDEEDVTDQGPPQNKRARILSDDEDEESERKPSSAFTLEDDFIVALLHEVLKNPADKNTSTVGQVYKTGIDFDDCKTIARLIQKLCLLCTGNKSHEISIGEDLDPTSLLMAMTESCMAKLPALFVNVHKFVADRLDYTPEKLDKEYLRLAQMTDRPKRNIVTHLTNDMEDPLQTRSDMALLISHMRHRDEALKKLSTIVQCSVGDAERLFKTGEEGLDCTAVSNNSPCIFPSVTMGSDGVPELEISDNSSTEANFAVQLLLPIKLKIGLSTTAFDKTKTKQKQQQQQQTSKGQDMTEKDKVGMEDLNENTEIFNPLSLKNKMGNGRDVSTYVSRKTMMTILRDPVVKLRNMNSFNFSNLAAEEDTRKYVMDYIKTNVLGVLSSSNSVVECLTHSVRNGLRKISSAFGEAIQVLANLTKSIKLKNVLLKHKAVLLRALTSSAEKNKAIECFIGKVLEKSVNGIKYAQTLYMLCLCVELYVPGPAVNTADPWQQGAHDMITAMVLGSLRLIVSDHGCTGTNLNEMEPKKPEITTWTYLYGGGKYQTSIDHTRSKQSTCNITLGQTAFHARVDGKIVQSKLYSAVQGGGNMETNGFLTMLFKPSSKSSHIIITPRYLVPHTSSEDIQVLMTPERFDDLITSAMCTEGIFGVVIKYYKEMSALINVVLVGKTATDLVPIVLQIHGQKEQAFEMIGITVLDWCREVATVINGGAFKSIEDGAFFGCEDEDMDDAENNMTEDEIMNMFEDI